MFHNPTMTKTIQSDELDNILDRLKEVTEYYLRAIEGGDVTLELECKDQMILLCLRLVIETKRLEADNDKPKGDYKN